MRFKRPHHATLDQVRITREKDAAVIEYIEPGIETTHFKLGPGVKDMTDREILDRFNRMIETVEYRASEYDHVAIEIPSGNPQIEYFEESDQWTPRGHVLRCIVDDGGPDNEPVIHIDEHELSWREFGRLMLTFAGWGMRIVFVPDNETHIEPLIEVREPEPDEP